MYKMNLCNSLSKLPSQPDTLIAEVRRWTKQKTIFIPMCTYFKWLLDVLWASCQN